MNLNQKALPNIRRRDGNPRKDNKKISPETP
jgi:hypothetical protein